MTKRPVAPSKHPGRRGGNVEKSARSSRLQMTREPTPRAAHLIRMALEHRRSEFLRLGGLTYLEPPTSAWEEDDWLHAEALHWAGSFSASSAMFSAWITKHAGRDKLLPLLCVGRLRLAYHAMRRDERAEFRGHLQAADEMITGDRVRLDGLVPSLEWLHAAELEFHGSLEIGRARMHLAYEEAVARGQAIKAARIASEVGRMLANSLKVNDARLWQLRALDHLGVEGCALHSRTVRVRLAKLFMVMRRHTQARQMLHQVEQECSADSICYRGGAWCLTPEPLLASLTSLHELGTIEEGSSDATRYLSRAIELARDLSFQDDLVHLHRDQARWYLIQAKSRETRGPSVPVGSGPVSREHLKTQRSAGDEEAFARAAIQHAIAHALSPRVARRLTLLSLASDLRFNEELIGFLPASQRRRWQRALRDAEVDLRALLKPRFHGQVHVPELRSRAADRLARVLDCLRNEKLELAGAVVWLGSGEVFVNGERKKGHLEPQAIEMLKALVEQGPLDKEELEGRGIGRVEKVASDLRRMVGEKALPELSKSSRAAPELKRYQVRLKSRSGELASEPSESGPV